MKKWLKKIVLNWFKDEIDQLIWENITDLALVDHGDLEIEIERLREELT